MSHIEEMIRELCPNGVEYKKLKNLIYNYLTICK